MEFTLEQPTDYQENIFRNKLKANKRGNVACQYLLRQKININEIKRRNKKNEFIDLTYSGKDCLMTRQDQNI